jgi:hypothetical protein
VVFFTAHLLESRLKVLIWLDAIALPIAVAAGVAAATEMEGVRADRPGHGRGHGHLRGADARRGRQRGAAGVRNRESFT